MGDYRSNVRDLEFNLFELAGELPAREVAFYEGKVATASFFALSVLPELAARRVATEAVSLDVMRLDERSQQ